MNSPSLKPHDFTASFLSIIEETQQFLAHHACEGVATTWLPICQSLNASHGAYSANSSASSQGGAPARLLQATASKPTPAGHVATPLAAPPVITPVTSSVTPPAKSFAEKNSPAQSEPSSSFTASSTEPATHSAPSTRKIGKWTLQSPPDVPINTQEIGDWLKKRGLSDQSAEKPRVLASKKIALFPVMILYTAASPHLTSLKRLCQAIDEKLNACTLVQEEAGLFQFLYEALERGRIDLLLFDPHLPLPKDIPIHPQLLPLDPLDLTENRRKIDIWKKLVGLLGQDR